MHFVILGGGIAGLSAIKSIRNRDKNSTITVITNENTKPYFRPMLPLLLNDKKNELDILFPDDLFKKYNTNAIFDTVSNLNINSKELALLSNKKIKFDKLLIAAGSIPVIPDIPGIQSGHFFTLRNLEDAKKIKNASLNIKNAVIIGAGFVGIKTALALNPKINVTIVEKLPQILNKKLDKKGAEIISSLIENKSIKILTSADVTEIITNSGKITGFLLANGKTINTDMLIIASGGKPNVDNFKNSGLKIKKGIIINEFFETNNQDIYAAGDVAEYQDLLTHTPSISASWTNAIEMGTIAGTNMTGKKIKYPGFLTTLNAIEIADVPVITAGIVEPDNNGYEVIIKNSTENYKKLVFKNDFLAGALFINTIKNAGIYTNLIKNQIQTKKIKEKLINGTINYVDFIKPV